MAAEFGKQVGEFSNAYLNNRRQIRSAKNPMDRCTVVSILPKEIDEVKVTIDPGMFHINPGTYENPATLIVGSSAWWKDIGIEQPLLEITNSSIQVAESIVRDYCNGMFGCDMDGAMPGLFYVLGEHKPSEIKLKFKDALETAREKQNNWYTILIRVADSLWARSNGNPLTISNEMRIAAKGLNQENKPWLQDFEAPKLDKCKYCGGLRNSLYPICPSCKAIDTTHPLAKEIKFAV